MGGLLMGLNRVRRAGAYAPLSAHYYKDDAIDEAGPEAELLYVRGLAFCAEVLSDGYISDRQLIRFVGSGLDDVMGRAKALAAAGLWERSDGGYIVRSWLEWNRSRAEITRYQEKDAARKRPAGDDSEPDPTPPERPRGTPKPSPAESATDSKRIPRGIQAESATASAPTPVGVRNTLQAPDLDRSKTDPDREREQTLPLAVLAAHDKLDRFPEFWATYPRKIAKRAAVKAWQSAMKRGDDPDLIISVARRYSAEKSHTEMRHVAHASSWLNGRRYNDPAELGLRLVSGGNSNGYSGPFQNPADQSVYDEEL